MFEGAIMARNPALLKLKLKMGFNTWDKIEAQFYIPYLRLSVFQAATHHTASSKCKSE